MESSSKLKVAVVQDSPVFFDKEACLQKTEELTRKLAEQGCQLIVFPESFIPGYPRGFTFGATVGSRTDEGRQYYLEYVNQSVDLSGTDGKRLAQLAADCGAYLVVGITEKDLPSGSLYCSMVYLSPTHGILGVHRKIKPTGTERIVWSEAGGESLVSFDTAIGRMGGLICWENYMPLARMAMYQKGVQLYIAPTADSRPAWTTTMRQIALEGRCFVLASNQYFTKSMYPERYQSLLDDQSEEICPGGSVIVSPMGEILQGPIFGKTGALIATLDMDDITRSKLDFDPIGHYARPDIFQFSVNNQPDTQTED